MDRNKELWNGNAKDYSTLMRSDGFFAEFGKEMLEHTVVPALEQDINKKLRVLDVACGTGSVTINAATYLKDRGTVVATDISPDMINILRDDLNRLNITNVETYCMNGESMTGLESNQFDFSYSSFGLVLFNNKIAGLSEMYRVLKKGGRCAITASNKDFFALKQMQAAFKELGGDMEYPDDVLRRITIPYDDELRESFECVGFKNVEIYKPYKYSKEIPIEVYRNFLEGNPAINILLTAFPEDRQSLVLPTLISQLYREFPNGLCKLHCYAIIAIGEK